jgi:hypothetical protein
MHLDLDLEDRRALVLRPLWQDAVDVWRDIDAIRNVPAARRLLDAGADPSDLSIALRAASLDAVFAALCRIDGGGPASTGAEGAAGGWRLVRTAPDGALTRETLDGLSEGLLAQDPSGRAGVDLRR